MVVCGFYNAKRTKPEQHYFTPADFLPKEVSSTPIVPEEPKPQYYDFSAMDAFAMGKYGLNNVGEQMVNEQSLEAAAPPAAMGPEEGGNDGT